MSQDELTALFNRTLTLEPVKAAGQVEVPNAEPKIIYTSMHYIQPTRVDFLGASPVSPPASPPALSPPPSPPVQPKVDHTEVIQFLSYHGIQTSGLSYAQLELFRTVQDSQRAVLLELWKVAPPTTVSDWETTTVDQEITLANLRYDQMQQEEIQAQLMAEAEAASVASAQQQQQQQQQQHQQQIQLENDTVMSQGSVEGTPLTPIQSADGSWVQTLPTNYMEPYMMLGYEDQEMLSRREFEDSAREAIMAEAVDIKDHHSVAMAAVPTTLAVDNSTTNAAASTLPRYNPSHKDPVYDTERSVSIGGGGFMTVADWRRRKEEEEARRNEMANQYGRLSCQW